MRDLLFLMVFSGSALTALRFPFIGLLIWAWISIAAPHISTFYFYSAPINTTVAALVFSSFFLHNEFQKFTATPTVIIMIAFAIWILVSQTFSLQNETSLLYSDRFFKVMIFVVLCTQTLTTKLRFHAMLWVFVYIMAFFGIKGGLYTILKMASGTYYGHTNTMLYDNNHIGIALAAALPIFLYMFEQVKWRYLKVALIGVIILSVFAVLGTHSRGAFIALIVFAGVMWLRSSRKLLTAIAVLAISIPALNFMPAEWTQRMNSIQNAEEDGSFLGRVDAWIINYKLAKQSPLTGAGLRNSYRPEIAKQVDTEREPRAAHSIYFEVLGGMGFIGLFLYLCIFAGGFFEGRHTMKKYRDIPEERWRSRFGFHVQTSILAFCVGGASVSLEMWEGYLMLLAMASVVRKVQSPIEAEMVVKNLEDDTALNRVAALARKNVQHAHQQDAAPKYIMLKDPNLYRETDRHWYRKIDSPR